MSTLRSTGVDAGRPRAGQGAYDLWRRWVWANIAGWAIGWVVHEIIMETTFHGWPGHRVGAVVAYGVGGLLIGTAQWMVLQRAHQVSAWWIGATALAAALARWLDQAAFPMLGTLGLGVLMGIAQWTFLRRLSIGTGWWIAASTVAFLIAGWIGVDIGQALWDGVRWLLPRTLPKAAIHSVGTVLRFGTLAVQGAVMGALFGAMTGVVLVPLLRGGCAEAVEPDVTPEPRGTA